MRTTRRKLLGLLGLGAAAAALGASNPAEATPLTERQRIDAILANPEKHPDLMTRADAMRGGPSFFGAKPMPVSEYMDAYMEGQREATRRVWLEAYKTGLEDAQAAQAPTRGTVRLPDSAPLRARDAGDASRTPDQQDDAAYIQGMIDQASASGGGVVRLENRTYTINRPIDMRGCKNVRFGTSGGTLIASPDFQGDALVVSRWEV